MKHVIAFDISMGKSYMVIYNAQKQCVFESEIKHSKPDFKKLQEKIHKLTDETGESPEIVFEATGIYSRQLERFMQNNQYTYCLLNPLEAKIQCDSLRIHKTDRSDAHRLALTHFTVTRRVSTGTDNLFYQLKSLSRLYSELDDELSIIRGRMHKVIQLTFPELERIFTSKSDLFLNFVQLFPHPDCVLGLSKTIIKNRIRANTNKKISNITAEKKAIQILEIAKICYPAVSQNDVLCDQLKLYARRYQELLHQKEICISKMVYVAEQRAEYDIIRSLPGIGPNTAVRLMAEIGDITRFNNNKQLNAFAGIDIRRFQSGKTFFKDKINKRGNKHLRKLLFLIIQNMIKQRRYGQNHIVEYYDKLKTQPYNKCHKVASIACVNKLLKLLFYLITHNMHYDYRLAA
ncbi:IS110 family transposase [Bacillus sp. TH44]|uniref:IS110 family transposase n=1 Tax=unclassified Bacillus (in: firmicutes) TaxID=185979 RepID=UPI001913D0E3|nr:MULTISPECIES: IS110 family transposase [unclassified Bacillus (in: firmicutes)]MBK5358733.1 IS110 family transposase [Bacillus sp. TH44]MBK5345787.1 IS110 family transposase [Bacillus sp. TH45]MBK5348710.1 IS110 family transposase [Bacillus sp. TH45]MBK5350607.1 IS110 family transposase [Bacillus sp. TH45]MBK5358829.1 IS110 family transposase [Bacillus sp. TH44]